MSIFKTVISDLEIQLFKHLDITVDFYSMLAVNHYYYNLINSYPEFQWWLNIRFNLIKIPGLNFHNLIWSKYYLLRQFHNMRYRPTTLDTEIFKLDMKIIDAIHRYILELSWKYATNNFEDTCYQTVENILELNRSVYLNPASKLRMINSNDFIKMFETTARNADKKMAQLILDASIKLGINIDIHANSDHLFYYLCNKVIKSIHQKYESKFYSQTLEWLISIGNLPGQKPFVFSLADIVKQCF